MLFLLFYKVMDIIFSKVFIPAIIMLFMAVLISVSDAYKSLFFSY